MDTLAHGLWTYALASVKRQPPSWKLLVFFAAFPDLVWLPTILLGPLDPQNVAFIELYNVSHSLLVFGAATLLISALRRRWFLVTWPWAFHILIDMPGHKGSISTPFLWPVSNFTLPGWWDWLTLRMLIGNYIVLGVVFLLLHLRRRRRAVAT